VIGANAIQPGDRGRGTGTENQKRAAESESESNFLYFSWLNDGFNSRKDKNQKQVSNRILLHSGNSGN